MLKLRKPTTKLIFYRQCHRAGAIVWRDGGYSKLYFLSCVKCGKSGPIRRTRNGAIKAWNRLFAAPASASPREKGIKEREAEKC
jgi:hypothetical protein